MERRKCTREFKREAVKLITERGVTVVQASHVSFRISGGRSLRVCGVHGLGQS